MIHRACLVGAVQLHAVEPEQRIGGRVVRRVGQHPVVSAEQEVVAGARVQRSERGEVKPAVGGGAVDVSVALEPARAGRITKLSHAVSS